MCSALAAPAPHRARVQRAPKGAATPFFVRVCRFARASCGCVSWRCTLSTWRRRVIAPTRSCRRAVCDERFSAQCRSENTHTRGGWGDRSVDRWPC
eukprot:5744609-Pleurochrysis_carterae.AAC.4